MNISPRTGLLLVIAWMNGQPQIVVCAGGGVLCAAVPSRRAGEWNVEYCNTASERAAALYAGEHLAEFADRSDADHWVARIPLLDASELDVRESIYYTAKECPLW